MKTTKTYFLQNMFALAAIICILATACETAPATKEKAPEDTTAMKADTTQVFDHLLVNNKKDPACGMPVSAGIGDTAHYKDKILGFCSKECKAEFKKNPEALLAAAEIKK